MSVSYLTTRRPQRLRSVDASAIAYENRKGEFYVNINENSYKSCNNELRINCRIFFLTQTCMEKDEEDEERGLERKRHLLIKDCSLLSLLAV